jgi:hypothetical protein
MLVGVIDPVTFVQEPQILNVLVLELIAGVGTRLSGYRETSNRRAGGYASPLLDFEWHAVLPVGACREDSAVTGFD